MRSGGRQLPQEIIPGAGQAGHLRDHNLVANLVILTMLLHIVVMVVLGIMALKVVAP